ncbi:MAG: hypothetical protein BAJALOKI1v1_250030 [Promethearchaeota archaeon]|nr:MAG: hypothetical protein BAJALOKI1v1_250030 [Candidatus Lokiarchaeota archaeon]
MVIGLKYGRVIPNDIEVREKSYDVTKEFINKFKKKNNSIECKDLLQCDSSTNKGRFEAKNRNSFKCLSKSCTRCTTYSKRNSIKKV